MNRLVSFALLGVLLGACSNNVDLAIDNPTEFSVEVSVDTLRVEVPPKQVVWVEMGKGEHQITLQNDSVIKYDFQDRLYMINPTLSEYFLNEQYYGSPAYQDSYVSILPSKKITLLGQEMEGNFDVIKDVINKVNWDYGPRETLPEMVQVDSDEQYTLLLKLTDVYEIISSMQTAYSEDEAVNEENTTETEAPAAE